MPRNRALSDEGLRLFNVAHVPRHRLKDMLHSMFWSGYDERLRDILHHCRGASRALLKLLNEELSDRVARRVEEMCNNAVHNAVYLMLSEKNKHRVQKNYKFYTDVMRRAHEDGDHQTTMLYYLALSNEAMARLQLKLPKRMRGIFEHLREEYDTESHMRAFLCHGFNDKFLPSIFSIQAYLKQENNQEMRKDIFDYLSIYGYMYYFINHELIPLYQQVAFKELMEASYKIVPRKKEEEPTFEFENPIFGKRF